MLLLYAAVASGAGGDRLQEAFSTWVHPGLFAVAAGACAYRAATIPAERAGWTALALAPATWALGEIVWELAYADADEVPYPSWSDALWVGSYVPLLAGLALLLRAQLGAAAGAATWLDAAIAATALCAFASVVALGPVFDVPGGRAIEVATDLAYPLLDLAVLAAVVAAIGLTRWRPGAAFLVFGVALGAQAAADIAFARSIALGTYEEGSLLDPARPAAMLLIAWAGGRPRARLRGRAGDMRVLVAPVALAAVALAVLVAGRSSDIPDAAAWLAIVALALTLARLAVAFRENAAMLASARRDARTDALTGLGNRRALLDDLARALTEPVTRRLVLFDLDGFKGYNDVYGHPAGDQLLARLAGRLADASPGGRAYRLGGDEFCLLVSESDGDDAQREGVGALSEQGEGFAIGASWGSVALPVEAVDVAGALGLADRRLYARKESRPVAATRQARDVLLSAMQQRQPDLHEHSLSVTNLAVAVARRLGMSGEEVDVVGRAADLHDIGKIAIPETILAKAGPLDEEEWRFMRRHTIIGEEILSAAPALQPVGALVRASHERWDGSGYPDGLAGEAIPLGARIIAVCDSFSAMCQARAYKKAMAPADALEEVRRKSDMQFDPRVVEAFGVVVTGEFTEVTA